LDQELTVHILLNEIPLVGNIHDKTIKVKMETTVAEVLSQAVKIFKTLGMSEPPDNKRFCITKNYQVVIETRKMNELIDARQCNANWEPAVSVQLSLTPKTPEQSQSQEKLLEFAAKILHKR
jgi:hypothetical protein